MVDARTGKIITQGAENSTGIPVNAEGANTYHAWYRAMSLISMKSAAVPRFVYQKSKGGRGREKAENHYAYSLVNRQANEEQTAFQFWLQMTGHVASRGNGYAILWRNRVGGPVTELIPTDPDRTYPVREGGKIWYIMYPFGMGENEKGYRYKAEEVLHFRGWGFDGLVGYSVWHVAASEIALGKAERKLAASRFRNSGRPSMILESEGKIPVPIKKRIIQDWQGMHEGVDNAGKTAILDAGLKAKPIQMTAEELQQSGAATMSLVAISNYTGVPVTKLGGGKPYATQEQEDRAFINDGLDFYLNLMDDETSAKLLTEPERVRGLHINANREALLNPDMKAKFDVLRTATGGRPILTPNEARDRIDMPPSEEPDADELLTPLNMGKGGSANDPTNPADDGPGRPPSETNNQDQNANATRPQTKPGEDVASDKAIYVMTEKDIREATRYAITFGVTRMIKRVGNNAKAAGAKGSTPYVDFATAIRADNRTVFGAEFSTASRLLGALGVKDNDVAGYTLSVIEKDYLGLIDSATESTIAARAKAVYDKQMLTLPETVADIFLPNPS